MVRQKEREGVREEHADSVAGHEGAGPHGAVRGREHVHAPRVDDELQRAKIRHQAEATFALDSPEDLALWHTSAALMNLPSSYDDRLREVAQVKRAEVDALARRLFDPRRALLTLVGPVHASQVAKLEQMLGRPAGSTRWLGPVRDDAPEAAEIEPIELLGLSQWAQRAARPQKKARAAKRSGT